MTVGLLALLAVLVLLLTFSPGVVDGQSPPPASPSPTPAPQPFYSSLPPGYEAHSVTGLKADAELSHSVIISWDLLPGADYYQPIWWPKSDPADFTIEPQQAQNSASVGFDGPRANYEYTVRALVIAPPTPTPSPTPTPTPTATPTPTVTPTPTPTPIPLPTRDISLPTMTSRIQARIDAAVTDGDRDQEILYRRALATIKREDPPNSWPGMDPLEIHREIVKYRRQADQRDLYHLWDDIYALAPYSRPHTKMNIPGATLNISAGPGIIEGQRARFVIRTQWREDLKYGSLARVIIEQEGDFLAGNVRGGDFWIDVPNGGAKYFSVPTVNDDVRESDGVITVRLLGKGGTAVHPLNGVAHVPVSDDDQPGDAPNLGPGETLEAELQRRIDKAEGKGDQALVKQFRRALSTLRLEGLSMSVAEAQKLADAARKDDREKRADLWQAVANAIAHRYRPGAPMPTPTPTPAPPTPTPTPTPTGPPTPTPAPSGYPDDSLTLEEKIQFYVNRTAHYQDPEENRWRRALAAVRHEDPPYGLEPIHGPEMERMVRRHYQSDDYMVRLWREIMKAAIGQDYPLLEDLDNFYNNTRTEAWVTLARGFFTGNVNWPSDTDWIKISIRQAGKYQIGIVGKDTGRSRWHLHLDGSKGHTHRHKALSDPQIIAFYDHQGRKFHEPYNDVLQRGVKANSVFYAEVGSGAYPEIGGYALSLHRGSLDEVGDNRSTGSTIRRSGKVSGVIEHPSDVDWHRVWLTGGKTHQIRMSGNGAYVTLYDDYGRIAATPDIHGDAPFRVLVRPDQDGYYYAAAAVLPGRQTGANYTITVAQPTAGKRKPILLTSPPETLPAEGSLESRVLAQLDQAIADGDTEAEELWRRTLRTLQGKTPPKGSPLVLADEIRRIYNAHVKNRNPIMADLWLDLYSRITRTPSEFVDVADVRQQYISLPIRSFIEKISSDSYIIEMPRVEYDYVFHYDMVSYENGQAISHGKNKKGVFVFPEKPDYEYDIRVWKPCPNFCK